MTPAEERRAFGFSLRLEHGDLVLEKATTASSSPRSRGART